MPSGAKAVTWAGRLVRRAAVNSVGYGCDDRLPASDGLAVKGGVLTGREQGRLKGGREYLPLRIDQHSVTGLAHCGCLF